MYTRKFVLGLLRFAEKPTTLLEIYESKTSITEFPVTKLKETICKAYSVTVKEFDGKKRSGKLPDARMTFSLVLLRLGFRNKDIVSVTGWLPPRITNSVITAEALYASDDNYRMMVDTIIKSVKASII